MSNIAQDFPTEQIKHLFINSFCDFDISLQPHGYFGNCQINTYLMAIPQFVLLFFAIPKLGNAPGGGSERTKLKSFKMGLAALHVAVTSLYGPEVFNVLSLTISYAWLFVAFLCAFMELNGFSIPRTSLLGYYFVCCLGYGYYVISAVARGNVDLATDSSLHAATFLFLTSFFNACFRDIGDAVEANEA